MTNDDRKVIRQSGQLNAAIGADLMDAFHRAIEVNGHKKKAVVKQLVRLYVEGKVKI